MSHFSSSLTHDVSSILFIQQPLLHAAEYRPMVNTDSNHQAKLRQTQQQRKGIIHFSMVKWLFFVAPLIAMDMEASPLLLV